MDTALAGARMLGKLTAKGVTAVQEKAERDNWSEKASDAAARAKAAAKSGYESATGRDAKTDGLVVGMAGAVAATTAAASAAATAAAAAPLVAVGALAAKGAGDQATNAARDRYGEEKVDSAMSRTRAGLAAAAGAVAAVGRELAAGYREGRAVYRNGPTLLDAPEPAQALPVGTPVAQASVGEIGVAVMAALPGTTQGETGWYMNPTTGVAEYWLVTAEGWVQGVPPS